MTAFFCFFLRRKSTLLFRFFLFSGAARCREFELTAYLVSNVDRAIRFCRSFLFYHQYVDVRCRHSAGFARSHSRRFAFAVGYWGSRRWVFCGCGGGGGGGAPNLPSLSSPTAASALSVGVLVFRAGEDCCRGLIGSFHVVSGTLG